MHAYYVGETHCCFFLLLEEEQVMVNDEAKKGCIKGNRADCERICCVTERYTPFGCNRTSAGAVGSWALDIGVWPVLQPVCHCWRSGLAVRGQGSASSVLLPSSTHLAYPPSRMRGAGWPWYMRHHQMRGANKPLPLSYTCAKPNTGLWQTAHSALLSHMQVSWSLSMC